MMRLRAMLLALGLLLFVVAVNASAEESRIQRGLWRLAGQSLNAHPVATAPRLYVDSLNEMFDDQNARLAGLNNRVPNAVLALELFGAALALGLLAFYLSLLGKGLAPIVAAAFVVSALSISAASRRPTSPVGVGTAALLISVTASGRCPASLRSAGVTDAAISDGRARSQVAKR